MIRSLMVASLVAPLIAWLAFQRRPAWFQPVMAVDGDFLQAARRDLTNQADAIGDRLARREVAELRLDAGTINGWIAAAPRLSQEVGERVPPEVMAAAVAFEPGLIRLGLHSSARGVETIWNMDIAAAVSKDGGEIEIAPRRIRGGALPLPRRTFMETVLRASRLAIDERSGAITDDNGSVIAGVRFDAATGTLLVRNRFVWPNGRRPFRIEQVSTSAGALEVRLAPM